ncbi:serine protease [Actinoplanes sp. LDG1-06]|uniref:Serine protease n=1 Tax=Paractinoplanes ovalisporus TaxID=2810368 RepID=A0ABS2A5E0_9ACTN|nr:tetratricopeptide repeat protein [Actinoplanes ovalisporus]MBM2615059.1 serine protease [Actinoplanes ovalisporus]
MHIDRVVGIHAEELVGSGYLIGSRLVLTSAHVASVVDAPIEVITADNEATYAGSVRWRGSAGGRDDVALVEIDDADWPEYPVPTRWGRVATGRPGTACETAGFPVWARTFEGRGELWHSEGRLNPGSGHVGDRYYLTLTGVPPASPADGSSPWAGLSGAALFCGDLLTGVIAWDPPGAQHGHLAAVPVYAFCRDPGFLDMLAAHHVGTAILEPVELQEAAEIEVLPAGSAASLLRARAEVVRFRGRDELMESLRGWCVRPGRPVHLVHGPGGQGKTRVAQELCSRLTSLRWATLWLRNDAAADSFAAVAHSAVPMIVVVDYAESRKDQVVALLRAASRHNGREPLRILLIARAMGPWWEDLSDDAESMLDGTRTTFLSELEKDPAGRSAAYGAAVKDYATVLAKAMPGTDWLTISTRLSSRGNASLRDDTALTIHMTALADLLDAATTSELESPVSGAAPVEDRLLHHERRYWRRTARGVRELDTIGDQAMEDALVAAMAFGAADRRQADALLERLDRMEGHPYDRRAALRDWISHLYPGTDDRIWGSMQPDRLVERFVGRRMANDAALIAGLIPVAGNTQRARLLTVYSRAVAHPAADATLGETLTEMCIRHRDDLTQAMIDVAPFTEAAAPLIAALFRILDSTGVEGQVDVLQRIPVGSTVLAEVGVHAAQRVVDDYTGRLADDVDTLIGLVSAYDTLSVWSGRLGRYEAAVRTASDAVDGRRAMADGLIDDQQSKLADSLSNLAVWLGALGRRTDALAAIREAHDIYLGLQAEVDIDPDGRPQLARSYSNLSVRLADVGAASEALEAGRASVRIWRELAAQDDRHRSELAAALTNLAVHLAALSRHGQSLVAVDEAVQIYRQLAATNPDSYLHDLARTLNNLANGLAVLGYVARALASSTEAVGIYRRLTASGEGAFQPELASCLNNRAVLLDSAGDRAGASETAAEAVGILRRLRAGLPDAFLPDLAASLVNQARLEPGSADSSTMLDEAVRHYEALIGQWPGRYGPALAEARSLLAQTPG